VANRALEVLAADRRLTPSGSLTQIGKGSDGVEGVAGDVAFGMGSDAGQVVGDACGSTLVEADG
jgi:hypothetical protein